MSNWLFHARRILRKMWFRTGAFCLFAVVGALAAIVLAPYVPRELAGLIGGRTVDQLLAILAGAMLPVATFSLATMVAGYQAATSNVTPRAAALLLEDRQAQRALATFIGAFLYSVVGLIALNAELYGEAGRVILFGFTLAVLLVVVATLVGWIDDLARLGQVGETIDRIEEAARAAIETRTEPFDYGGRPYSDPPSRATRVLASGVGYIQHVDVGALCEIAIAADSDLYVEATPGTFVHRGDVLGFIGGDERTADEDLIQSIARCFVIGGVRTFDQDPRFGFVVLAEVASRALSPAVNDPGTAVDVVGTGARLLTFWAERATAQAAEPASRERLFVRPLEVADFFDDLFRPIARDGAALIEVGVALQKALKALGRLGANFEGPAREHGHQALRRAEQAMTTKIDLETVRRASV